VRERRRMAEGESALGYSSYVSLRPLTPVDAIRYKVLASNVVYCVPATSHI